MTKKSLLQFLERSLLGGSPVPDSLPGQRGERSCGGGELREELVTETMTEERANVLRILGYRPDRDGLEFLVYRLDSLASHDESHKLYF